MIQLLVRMIEETFGTGILALLVHLFVHINHAHELLFVNHLGQSIFIDLI